MSFSQNKSGLLPRIPRPSAPVIDLSKSRSRTQETASPSSGFAAVLEGVSLADLVQLECLRGLTRGVRVRAEGCEGMLYFDQGQLVHAETGDAQGEEAACQILAWETGTVEPVDASRVQATTIHTSWQVLLLTAAQRQDERGRGPQSHSQITHSTERSQSELERARTSEAERWQARGVRALVHLDEQGGVLQGPGAASDLPDRVAYAARLAQLIGEDLGLAAFDELDCSYEQKSLHIWVEGAEIRALSAALGFDVSEYRESLRR